MTSVERHKSVQSEGTQGSRGERASRPIDDVAVWFPDVSETFYAIVPTARNDGRILR